MFFFQDDTKKESDIYEHIQDSDSHYDQQTMDVATADQQKAQEEQPKPSNEEEDAEPMSKDDDISMMETQEIKVH